jgi:GH15 family glucan-1,4-alpha-glucosidase
MKERRISSLVFLPMPDFQPIENHAVIGDLHTVALVALDGTIDFLCFPSFESPTLFASLLDAERGGFFSITPALEGARMKQLYLPDSNILLTRFLSADGVAEISDFMPVEEAENAHSLVRRVKTVRGEIRFTVRCAPRFDYGRGTHRCEMHDDGVLFIWDGMNIRLRSSVPLEIEGADAVATFTLRADEAASFVLEDADEKLACDADGYVARAFKSTLNYWRDWIGHCRYQGRWREQVNRSALTLKLLLSQPHGSLVAAPTFGLPEVIGGARNWDYRYTWIRDASFTIYALMRLGYTEEAGAFIQWIEARCRELQPDGSLQIMYRLDGRHELREETLDHLRGYRDSRPVRIGNGAAQQCQLDIHGELLDSVYLYNKWGLPISHDFWQNLVRLVDWVAVHWSEADAGIWESRKGPQEFLYSRLMCWVAVDRGIRLARKRSLPAPLARWEEVRDAIYRDIFANFWDAGQQTFVRHRGSTTVDAACLLMPLVKFIAPRDPRWLSTLAAIDRVLVEDSLVYRYGHDDPAHEGAADGTFCMCTFWFAECLAKAGDVKRARFVFEKMLGYANHVGLYAEQLGPAGEHLGNFPQAFTHLGLISAAYAIDRELQL